MIPRILHYCWFGTQPVSPTIKNCIASWKRHLPNFEIMLWNEQNSPMGHPFVQTAYKLEKYAFVSDYVRLWVIYKYGGVYLDTDMLLLKTLDPLLNEPFIGRQDNYSVNASIMAFPSGHQFILDAMSHYDKISFEVEALNQITIPLILQKTLDQFGENAGRPRVFDRLFFYPYPFEARTKGDLNYWKYIKPESYAVHLWDASWIEGFQEEMKRAYTSKGRFLLCVISDYFYCWINKFKQLFQ
ncbi:MAG: glycosyltransferase [Cyclobacteriaceae bacterium]